MCQKNISKWKKNIGSGRRFFYGLIRMNFSFNSGGMRRKSTWTQSVSATIDGQCGAGYERGVIRSQKCNCLRHFLSESWTTQWMSFLTPAEELKICETRKVQSMKRKSTIISNPKPFCTLRPTFHLVSAVQ